MCCLVAVSTAIIMDMRSIVIGGVSDATTIITITIIWIDFIWLRETVVGEIRQTTTTTAAAGAAAVVIIVCQQRIQWIRWICFVQHWELLGAA